MQHPAPTPTPRPAQDPTPAQMAAWARLHGYAGTPLPEPVEAYLQAESKPHRQASQQATEAEDLDLWPAIKRLYIGLGVVGAVAVAATTFWSRLV